MFPRNYWEIEDENTFTRLPRDAGGATITYPVEALAFGLMKLQEGLPVKHPSTQTREREECAAHAAEELARAFYADRKLKLDSLTAPQQIKFHGVIAAGLDTLLREAVERA